MLSVKTKINTNVLGVDIGHGSVKIAQASNNEVTCFGYTRFKNGAISSEGIIKDPGAIAAALKELIDGGEGLHGKVTTRTAAFSVPNAHTYNRILQLPKLPDDEMRSAVIQEAEQSIPRAISELLVDYDVIQQIDNELNEVLMMAIPQEVISSYISLFRMLSLTPVLVKSNIDATVDAIIGQEDREITSVIVDFGSLTTDLAIFDRTIRVTGTLNTGGNHLNKLIADAQGISLEQANVSKMLHGLTSRSEDKNLLPLLERYFETLFIDIRKIIRFFEDRSASQQKVQQIIAIGGGANMPGVADYISKNIDLPVKIMQQIPNVKFDKLEHPSTDEASLFATAFGLSISGSQFARKVSVR